MSFDSSHRLRSPRAAGRLAVVGVLAALAGLAFSSNALALTRAPFLGGFSSVSPIASTVPSIGDQNPYGVAVVPRTVGHEIVGDVLVSNFNNNGSGGGLQGTGSTIVQIPPSERHVTGTAKTFAQVPNEFGANPGLTTALAILPNGDVVVGDVPTTDGLFDTIKPGGLIILNPLGEVIDTISSPALDGPWDLAAVSTGPFTVLFVSNVLNGTVSRLYLLGMGSSEVQVGPPVVIATGFGVIDGGPPLVTGPTGVAVAGTSLGEDDTLYVADSAHNRIAAIPDPLFRLSPVSSGAQTVSSGGVLNDPLGLVLAPDGDIVTANGNDGNVVETSPLGQQFAPFDTGIGGGGLFGLALTAGGNDLYSVNDNGDSVLGGNPGLELLH